MKAWFAELWRLTRRWSRSVWGGLVMLLGFALDHLDEAKTVLTGYGLAPWIVTGIGLALLLIGRVAVERRLEAARGEQ